MIELRDYQTQAHMDSRRAVAEGHKKIIIQSPTGGGKTVIGAQLIAGAVEKENNVLFFAHRRELVYQCSDKLKEFGVRHGMIMSGEYMDTWAGVQVCSIDTFRARAMRGRIEMPDAKLIMIDEAHRSLSPTYLKVIEHYEERGAVIIGLTATPVRADGKGLGRTYTKMVSTIGVNEMITRGFLVPPVHYAPTIPDLTGVKTSKGDYDEGQLQAAMDSNELVGDIISNWIRLASDRQTIVFASGVQHSIHLKNEFLRQGIKAAHIDGNTPDHERDTIIKELREQRIQVICNCMVLTEGFDEPSISCIVLARPTKNFGLYLQMGGRGLRPDVYKTDCAIIDHAGAVYRHGKLDDPYVWDLTEGRRADKDMKREQQLREKTTITCVKCSAVYSGQLNCPQCNHIPEIRGRFVMSRTGDLVRVEDAKRPVNARDWQRYEKVKWFNQFIHYAEQKGYKRGWAHRQFKTKFGDWPDKDYPVLEHVMLEPEFKAYCRYLNIRFAKGKEKEREQREEELQAREMGRADING